MFFSIAAEVQWTAMLYSGSSFSGEYKIYRGTFAEGTASFFTIKDFAKVTLHFN